MMRWLLLLAGAGLVIAAVFRPMVSAPLLLPGLVLFLAGIGMVSGDVLGDHPDER